VLPAYPSTSPTSLLFLVITSSLPLRLPAPFLFPYPTLFRSCHLSGRGAPLRGAHGRGDRRGGGASPRGRRRPGGPARPGNSRLDRPARGLGRSRLAGSQQGRLGWAESGPFPVAKAIGIRRRWRRCLTLNHDEGWRGRPCRLTSSPRWPWAPRSALWPVLTRSGSITASIRAIPKGIRST